MQKDMTGSGRALRKHRPLLTVIVAAFWLLASQDAVMAAQPDRGLGINLHGIRYWSPALPFVDVFKQAGAWVPQRSGSQAWDTGERLDLDASGWIRSLTQGQQAAAVVMSGGAYPAGVYRVAYDGRGEITLGLDARVVSRQGNELVVEVRPKHSVILKVIQTDPGDPVRNIRMMLPGIAPGGRTSIFNPVYLDYLRGFNVIRFMDWANTNLDDTSDWENRTRLDHATQDRKSGVALEYMLQFAKEAKANPWVNIPHAASDGYVRQMARLIKAEVPPGMKVYIEYSNEVWNSQFPQHAYAAREAARLGLKDVDAFYVRRSLQVFAIFEEIFGGSEQLVRVLSGQAVNTFRSGRLLSYPGIGKLADAYAIAPYFGHRDQLHGQDKGDGAAVPIETLMARLVENEAENRRVIRDNLALANKAGLQLIAYEAGQHVTNPPGRDEFCAGINRHPAMADIYANYLDIWERETNDALLVLFADMSRYGRSGCWGLSEYHGQSPSAAPKLRAVRARLDAAANRRQ